MTSVLSLACITFFKEFAAKEKLKIVIGAAPPRSGGAKTVRTILRIAHQIGLRDFLRGETEVCSPRRARKPHFAV